MKIPIYFPDIFVDFKRLTALNYPFQYLLSAVLLLLSCVICLLLPETGIVEPLPYSLQEAELFTSLNVGRNTSSNRWYSLKVLFNFKPPKYVAVVWDLEMFLKCFLFVSIRPMNGILKKTPIHQNSDANRVRGPKNSDNCLVATIDKVSTKGIQNFVSLSYFTKIDLVLVFFIDSD